MLPQILSSSISREQIRNPLIAKKRLTPLGPILVIEYSILWSPSWYPTA
jgi:hypothetical protein